MRDTMFYLRFDTACFTEDSDYFFKDFSTGKEKSV